MLFQEINKEVIIITARRSASDCIQLFFTTTDGRIIAIQLTEILTTVCTSGAAIFIVRCTYFTPPG